MATLRERVAERYPDLLPLLRIPEVGRLLTQAVSGAGMSPGSFMSKLRATRWFRRQSEPQRRWFITSVMDPGEARLQRQLFSAELIKQASTLGITLNSKQVKRYTESGLAQGIAPDSARGMANLLAFGRSTGQMGAGAFKTAHTAVRALGTGQWMREPPRAEAERWAADIALGRKTIDDFNAANAYAASHRFPHMAQQIKAGSTVADIAAPVVEAFAREMDWDPNGLLANLQRDPKFSGLLGIKDPKTNQVRMPTEYEARTMARQRDDWWQTTGGRQQDAAMSQALLQAFGRRV
jgi:hypothetical protein